MTSTSDRRFVVLEHRTDPHHFDLMIEAGDALWTWSVYEEAFPTSFDRLCLERIQDHRKAYLTYEGPISGGRGSVRRVEQGTFSPSGTVDPGERIEGRFDGDTWTFRFELVRTERTGRRENPVWTLRVR